MSTQNGQPPVRNFTFDGSAADYLGVSILAFLVTLLSLGIAYPFSVVLMERWKANHRLIDGNRLIFTGKAWSLFGNWILWLLLTVITLGIYGFWVAPKLQSWKWRNTSFATSF